VALQGKAILARKNLDSRRGYLAPLTVATRRWRRQARPFWPAHGRNPSGAVAPAGPSGSLWEPVRALGGGGLLRGPRGPSPRKRENRPLHEKNYDETADVLGRAQNPEDGPLGGPREPPGAPGHPGEPLGASGSPRGASGSLWEPLGSRIPPTEGGEMARDGPGMVPPGDLTWAERSLFKGF
jgi:hypothetical protein